MIYEIKFDSRNLIKPKLENILNDKKLEGRNFWLTPNMNIYNGVFNVQLMINLVSSGEN